MAALVAPLCLGRSAVALVASGMSVASRQACGRPGAVLYPKCIFNAMRGRSTVAVSGLATAIATANLRRRPRVGGRAATTVTLASRDVSFELGMGDAGAAHVGSGMEVVLVPCLHDNYAPVFHDPSSGATAVVDTPEVAPILAAVEARGWTLTHILNTHHHDDHTGGTVELKSRTGCQIIGPEGEAARIPSLDHAVSEGDLVKVGSLEAAVLEVGGHTAGHIAYYFQSQKVAFVGDTLFNLGCGRLFEGTPSQMWQSLCKLRDLPDDTVAYCAHEYTEANARFAMHLGGVPKLAERVAAIRELRQAGKATVPMLLGHEKETNPFLRADCPVLQEAVGLPQGTAPVEVFTKMRGLKDSF